MDQHEMLTLSTDLKGNPPPLKAQKDVAIVGMSCQFPGAKNLDEFWNLLLSGQDATGSVPSDRWQQSDYPYHVADSCKLMNAGFLSVPVDRFDSSFFGISPKEATFMDPQSRLLLELVWEGLENAGMDPTSLSGTNGAVFAGSWLNDYKDILLRCPGYDNFYRKYMGNSIGSMAARISFLLGMTGPALATKSGCSSDMVAVHMAVKSLRQDECGIAVACGVNLLLKPFDKDEMPTMLSPDGHCKTFDAEANGFARAEGVGVLILKRLPDAVRDKDRVWGIIKGSAITQEGLSKSMGTPTVYSEALAMSLALKDAEVDPSQVEYLEAHGTGTKVGDPMEIKAITQAYYSERRTQPLYIGSVKTNLGHTEASSGIAGIMKVILAMHNEMIPPHINLRNINPAINLQAIPAIIPTKAVEWKKEISKKRRMAGVSSFGITGTDAHVILEEPPILLNEATQEGPYYPSYHIVKFSAKSLEALNLLLGEFATFCASTPESLLDIAYTANIERASFQNRAVVIASTNEELVSFIKNRKYLSNTGKSADHTTKNIYFVFTGQGSQYTEMGKELYEFSSIFREHFDYCSQLLENNYNIKIKAVLGGKTPKNINQTVYSQICIFCVEYALTKLWEHWGIRPAYVLGHSLGECAAAVCAGILTVENGLHLVTKRSLLIDGLPQGKMLLIEADRDTVMSIMTKAKINLDLAAFNSSHQTVVSGDSEVVLEFSRILNERLNLRNVILKATHAFHSCHMDPILDELKQQCKSLDSSLGAAKCGYISGLHGNVIKANSVNAEYWVRQTREPVEFIKACETAVEECGCDIFLEIGPQPVLSAFLKSNACTEITCLPSIKKHEENFYTMYTSLGQLHLQNVPIKWENINMEYPQRKICLPTYPFIGKRFWPEVSVKSILDTTWNPEAHHPLLGREISNPLCPKLFENHFDINNDARLAFIADHRIGNDVIFPEAAYLEMCISAYSSLVQCGTPIRVDNLVIEAPLALCPYNSQNAPIPQTVVEHCNFVASLGSIK